MNTVQRIATIAGVNVADLDPELVAALGTRGADVTGEILAKAGISTADLPTAIEAARRCMDYGWSAGTAAEFVGTAAAIGAITGPSLLLVPNLARIASREFG